MSEKQVAKPVALAVGIALAGSFAAIETAGAADTGINPFAMTSLHVAYMLGEGEGSCGGDKAGEASCGGDKEGEGSCGGDKEGEGSCGGDKQGEGSCGGDKGEQG
ncbi:MAG: hypothetical protein ACE5OQ_15520, partial [Woeseia sp.]